MTGRIKSLSAGNACGFIRAEDGASVYFKAAAVLEHDLASLRIGQFVTFDLESGACPRAANVCVLHPRSIAGPPAKHLEALQFRYLGFLQSESTRTFQFQRLVPGGEAYVFTLTADLALFRKHCLGFQEGPGLCMHTLLADPDGVAAGLPASPRVLTDRDVLSYLASRPVRTKRARPKPPPRPHHEWHAV